MFSWLANFFGNLFHNRQRLLIRVAAARLVKTLPPVRVFSILRRVETTAEKIEGALSLDATMVRKELTKALLDESMTEPEQEIVGYLVDEVVGSLGDLKGVPARTKLLKVVGWVKEALG